MFKPEPLLGAVSFASPCQAARWLRGRGRASAVTDGQRSSGDKLNPVRIFEEALRTVMLMPPDAKRLSNRTWRWIAEDMATHQKARRSF